MLKILSLVPILTLLNKPAFIGLSSVAVWNINMVTSSVSLLYALSWIVVLIISYIYMTDLRMWLEYLKKVKAIKPQCL